MPFPLHEVQEIIALEAGCADWADLKMSADAAPSVGERSEQGETATLFSTPVLHVADVNASTAFYRDQLGFRIDFLHGSPPFYGAVSRDGARLHLKLVHESVFDVNAARKEGLIMAYIDAPSVRELYSEYRATSVEIVQKLYQTGVGRHRLHRSRSGRQLNRIRGVRASNREPRTPGQWRFYTLNLNSTAFRSRTTLGD